MSRMRTRKGDLPMNRLALVIVALLGFSGLAAVSSAQRNNTTLVPLNKMPRDLEVRYALSALPPHLRADATTYVLDPDKGYELNHKGTNGFSCFVERTEHERAK